MSEVHNLDDLWTYIGQRVIIGSDTYGTLRYCGITHFSDNECCGIELEDNVGNTDGSVHGIRYFTCGKNHGVFVLASEINVINDKSGTYLKVAAFLPSVIEIFNPTKASFMHDENFSPKKSSEDADSSESLGILPHLRSLDEESDWDDSMILTKDISKGLKSCKSKSDTGHNAMIVHEQTASILSLDNSSTLFHNRDEYHEMLNTTIVLPSTIVELDECQTDLNTTMILSDKKLEHVNQKHDKLSPFQIFACDEAVDGNGACLDLNSTMIFSDRSVETGNKFCVDLNTTVVLNDKCEESDKNRDISNADTVNVLGSPINVFSADSPKFASTPKQEIDLELNMKYISPIKPYELIQLDDNAESKNKLVDVAAQVPLPPLNETFDHAKFNSEERFTQDCEESAFTCKMNIQDQNTLERSNKPVIQCLTLDEPDANASELHEKQDTFSLSENYLNSTLVIEKEVDVKKNLKAMPAIEEESDTSKLIQEQKKDINILNVTHSVLGELENKLEIHNSLESVSEYGKIRTLDTTFKKIKGTDAKVTNTKALSFKRYPPKPFANRKSISHFGSSNFTNTELKPPESRYKRNSFSSSKNSLSNNDKTKIIYPTSKISVSIKENKNTAHQQEHLIDTHHANVTKIVRGKNERNIMRESSKLLSFKPNVTKKMPKNLSGHDETRTIIPSLDEMKPKEEIIELIDAKKSGIMLSPPQTSDILHHISTTTKHANINIRKPDTFINTYGIETCNLVCTLKSEIKASSTENVEHLKTSTQSKTETIKKTDIRTDALMKHTGLRRRSVAPAEFMEKDAAIRISTKCLSQQMNTRKSFRYSAGCTRNLDIHNMPTVSSFPSKGVSYPSKKSITHPPVIAASNHTRRPVTHLEKPATSVPKSSPSKESELHLPRTSSRIPQRDFSRIPRPFSSHPPRIGEENITSNPDYTNAVSCS